VIIFASFALTNPTGSGVYLPALAGARIFERMEVITHGSEEARREEAGKEGRREEAGQEEVTCREQCPGCQLSVVLGSTS
jgi:hypothetical protein